ETYRSKGTVRTYKSSLGTFFKGIYGEGSLEDFASRYFLDHRDYESDVQSFLARIKEAPPKTIHLRISSVRTFLLENHIELRQIFWRSLSRRIRGSDARTEDRVPSNLELRKILTHMPIQGKALYLTVSSSGMRIGETLQLRLEDIDLNYDPAKISLRGEITKSGDPRRAFISGEAKEYILEWLKCRDSYIKTAVGRSHIYEKSVDDDRLFPFDKSTADFIWVNALTKAQLNHKDSSTNRLTVHPHVLRKFFRTRLGAVIPTDVVEFLMGHEGYLTKEYRRYEVEELAKFYKKGESALVVMGGSEESVVLVNGLITDVAELKQEIEELKSEYSNLETAFTKSVDILARKIKNLEAERDLEEKEEQRQNDENREREHNYDRIERELKKEKELNSKNALLSEDRKP
ncbi:site-specific integrase, partial [Candidatus Bathyarchaeota archaeon]|nr:site-specific integrase [Candidatus Bathyarchaeota archaeon]